MAVGFTSSAGQSKIICASTDTKPTTYPNGRAIENGAGLWEYDTDLKYWTYDHGTHWVVHISNEVL